MSTEIVRESVPAWIHEVDFCHLGSGDGVTRLCGDPLSHKPQKCGYYDGEAICPSCGCPTCPRCAQLSALEDLFYDGEPA